MAMSTVQAALGRGAVAALVERELPLSLPQVVVPDALAALSQFAHAWRKQFAYPVIGVTGSNGKTTTKEMLGSILAQRGECSGDTRQSEQPHRCATDAAHPDGATSFRSHRNGRQQSRRDCTSGAAGSPHIGLVTNAGAAHLEGFGGLQGVAKGKGELFQALPAGARPSSMPMTISPITGARTAAPIRFIPLVWTALPTSLPARCWRITTRGWFSNPL